LRPTQTIALLFSDLVGSTELASSLGSVRMEQVRRDHFAGLREAIEGAGGTEVKSVGDGLMVSCPSAGSAVSCAVAIQQGVELRNRATAPQLAVRVGVALGDVVLDDGDWYGQAAVEAARLCAACEGGQILVTEVVRLLAAAGEGPAYRPVGPLRLKGLPEPVTTWSVVWEPLPREAEMAPLPAPLLALSSASFIGRRREREQLAGLWTRAREGTRGLVLVSGEPGIGKTRLATHLAVRARREGATVLYGRSSEEVGLPYEPWRQALSHLVESTRADLLRRHVERHGGELLRLAPALATRLGDAPEPRPTDPETERYLLFAATVGLLEEAAHDAPVLLILDDVHWSGRPTMALLRHLQLAAPTTARLLVVATHRPRVAPEDALDELLEELRRDPTIERIAVTGLGEDEVRSLLEATAGQSLDATGAVLAREVHRETEGNPFFVTELARHLADSGTLLQGVDGRWTTVLGLPELPRSVHEVITGRVARLGPDAARVLRSAAVIGREFDLALLARIEGLEEEALLDLLDRARAAALVTDSATGPGRQAFVHALVSHALEAELSATRRARLHERIAEALEERAGEDAEVANHWAAAGPQARAKALHYAGAAGRAALAQLAPDQAMEWFQKATALEQGMSGADPSARRELLLGLGEAQLHAGQASFRETLLDAARQAADAGDHDLLVRAALANFRGFASTTGFVDEERVEVLEQSLAHAPAGDPRRAKLLAQLAAELLWCPDHERRRALSDEAVALARDGGDRAALAHVLTLRATALWWPETLRERLVDAGELVALTDAVDDPLQRFWARTWSAITHIQAGDARAADRCLDTMRDIAGRLAHPRLHYVLATQDAWRAQLSGRIDEADRLMEHAAVLGTEAEEPDAFTLYAAQLGPIRWHQGRLAEITDLLEQISEGVPAVSLFPAMHALAEAEAGREEHARAMLDAKARGGFKDIPSDPVRLTALALWSELAARLGSVPAAERLLVQLEPVRDQVVLDSLGAFGAISRCAGMLAGVLGLGEESDAHFARAQETHERMHAASLAARTRADWGQALAARGGAEASRRARDLLRRAAAEARELGIEPLERRASEAVSRLDAAERATA
jgi:class 3 adenylate cyclase